MQGRATQEDGMMRTQVFVGIDVSKAQLDVAFRPEGRFSAPNDEAGGAQVLERLRAVPPTLGGLEATGGVGRAGEGGVGEEGGYRWAPDHLKKKKRKKEKDPQRQD